MTAQEWIAELARRRAAAKKARRNRAKMEAVHERDNL
jgi:hypothetical protein